MAARDLETDDDYQSLDDADLDGILERIKTITDTAVESETDRVMTGLRKAKNKLPEAEIVEVR